MRISQRDVYALRAGIRDQERKELELEQYRADWDARSARVAPNQEALILTPGDDLRIGDTLVSSEGGRSFYRSETLTRVVQMDNNAVWVEWGGLEDPNGGSPGLAALVAGRSGGQQIREDEMVLVERSTT